jgi:hypothetical protein
LPGIESLSQQDSQFNPVTLTKISWEVLCTPAYITSVV